MKLPDFLLDILWRIGRLFSKKVEAPLKQVAEGPDYHVPIQPPPPPTFAQRIVSYMEKKGYFIDRDPSNGNIVYVSGMTDEFGLNSNEPDAWNDLRLIIMFSEANGEPYIAFKQIASTAPGTLAALSDGAKKRGGVAHVAYGQYRAWQLGYHKGNKKHPALVQIAPVLIWRDIDADFEEDEDRKEWGIFGINQHSTKAEYIGARVGKWSEGCLVGWSFEQHLNFINLVKQWKRCVENPKAFLETAVIPGTALFE